MRMQGVFTSLLVTGALSESSVKQYEELCHTKDGTIEEISPSYKVLYKCGQVGNHNGEPVTSIATAKACAELCKATLGCTGSSWASKQKSCVLSGSRKGTAREYTLYMENVVGSDHFHKGEEDPFSKGSSETGSCEGLIEKFAAKLNECKCKNTNNSGGSTGGNSDRRLDDVGGRDVKPPFTVNSVRECIDACASYKDNECKRAIWTNNADGNFQRPCWLRGWNGVAKVPTKVGGYSSAHV